MILVIGYGNRLRRDDGVGQVVVEALTQRRDSPEVQYICCHQLTPELVLPIGSASAVMFVDARADVSAGHIVVEEIEPAYMNNPGAFVHHMTPRGLLASARELYDAVPSGVVISIGGASFDYGEQLSEIVQGMLPKLLETLQQLLDVQLKLDG